MLICNDFNVYNNVIFKLAVTESRKYLRTREKNEENLGVKLNKIITHNCKNISDNTNNI